MSKTVADDDEDDLCVALGFGLMGALMDVGWLIAPGSSWNARSGSVETFHKVVLDNNDNDEVEGVAGAALLVLLDLGMMVVRRSCSPRTTQVRTWD